MTPPFTLVAEQPAPAGLSRLASLLYPLDRQGFLDAYWQRAPLHLTGWPDRLAGVFDRSGLHKALALQHEAGLSVRVSGDHVDDDGGAGPHRLVAATDLAEHLSSGTSVCVDPIERADPALARLAADLRDEIGHLGPVSVKCYFSTPGYGFNTHLDAHVVTTLQLEGRKWWRVSPRPGVEFPVDNAFVDAAGDVRVIGRPPSALRDWERPVVRREEFVDVLLEPGDVLCLPAGTWHEAKAADEPSLALNVSFTAADLTGLLAGLAGQRLLDDSNWRMGLPPARTPAELGGVLAARAEQLARTLRAVAADPRSAEQLLGGAVDPAGRQPESVRGPAAARPAPELAPEVPVGRRVQCVLGVTDADKAADWYRRVLGSRRVSAIPEFGWVEVSTPAAGVSLGLTEVGTGVANGGAVLDFEVDDLERIRAVLAANGVPVDDEPVDVGLARVLSAHDLDGNRLMFFQSLEQGAGADDG